MIMHLGFPVSVFAVFPFDVTLLHPQRQKVEQETVLPATVFSGTLKNYGSIL